jgi:tetratricopeptide (TPR) repeat protein
MNNPQRQRRSINPWERRLRNIWQFVAAVSRDLFVVPLMFARAVGRALPGFSRFMVAASLDRLLLPLRLAGSLRTPGFLVFLFCLPSLLGIIVSVGTAVWISRLSLGDVESEYARAARDALAANKIDLACWCNRKLLFIQPNDAEPRLVLAQMAEKSGDLARTERLMRQVAPLAETGYAPAHLWMARKLMSEAPAKGQQQQVRQITEIQQHLRHAIEVEPRNMEARELLGNICARTGQVSEAIANLTVAAEVHPSVHLTLAQLFAVRGDRSLAEMHGRTVQDHFQKKLAANPDDIDAELGLAASDLFLGDSQKAIDVLTRGFERTHDKRFDLALTGAYVLAFDQTDPSNVTRRLDLIQKAWDHGSDSVAVLARLDGLTSGTGSEAQRARETLEKSIEQDKSSGLAHYALAGVAVRDGDLKKALVHAEAAYAAIPGVPEMGNNLAFLLMSNDPPDLDRAIKLADAAVNAAPDNPNFRETRGQILVKLQRYRDAVPDLEVALRVLKDMPGIHSGLADAYEHLGDRELAAKHRELAAAKTNAKPK